MTDYKLVALCSLTGEVLTETGYVILGCTV